jgi:hypothetical protein
MAKMTEMHVLRGGFKQAEIALAIREREDRAYEFGQRLLYFPKLSFSDQNDRHVFLRGGFEQTEIALAIREREDRAYEFGQRLLYFPN